MHVRKIVATRYQLDLILVLREHLAAKLRMQSTVMCLLPVLIKSGSRHFNINVSFSLFLNLFPINGPALYRGLKLRLTLFEVRMKTQNAN